MTTVPVFLALMPDDRLADRVQRYKDRTRDLAGPQLYLDDPPHLTTYFACFPESFRAGPPVADIVRNSPPPQVRIVGWHAFEADAMTGRNTLVCAIHPDDKHALRAFQQRIVSAVAAHRDIPATERRFAGRIEHLTVEQRECIAAAGFPFLGNGWQPHFTVASIDPAVWQTVLSALSADPPTGTYSCSAVAEYQLDGIRPVLRERFVFPNPPNLHGA